MNSYKEITTAQHFSSWEAEYLQKPLIISRTLGGFNIQGYFESLECPSKALLESTRVKGVNGFSILAVRPVDRFLVKEDLVYRQNHSYRSSSHWKEFREWMSSWKSPTLKSLDLPLYGGALGFLSYESSRFFSSMKFPKLDRQESSFFDYGFWLYDEVFVFDHKKEELFLCSCDETYEGAQEKSFRMQSELESYLQSDRKISKPPFPSKTEITGSNFSYLDYLKAIEKCRDYIVRGHSYQINLAQRVTAQTDKKAWEIYKDLVRINPVSYGAYFKLDGFELVCGSPELLIRKRGSQLTTRPIAGTRRLGSEEETKRFRQELQEDRKERAEHAMLVDLLRNDLGKVSCTGSVSIDTYAEITDYSHVMHLESQISSKALSELQPLDILASIFPGGTVTGVPKLRTMEIIHELEPDERDIYTGSLGYFSYTGDMEFNIVIRSLLYEKGGKVSFHIGGGLTYDCLGRSEYKETLNKGRSQLLALEVSDHVLQA